MPSNPKISILMTAYNREKYIGQAIESVLKASYADLELIVVDDCSTDATVEIARSYQSDERIRVYVNERNLGDYPNRNKAASYARGKYIKYLDSDDFFYPLGLETFVSCMDAHPEAALGLCSARVQEFAPFPVKLSPREAYLHHFFKQGILDCGPSGTVMRRDVFEEMGGFSGKRMVGDMELWLKISARHPVLILPPALIFWRIHDGQEFTAGIQSGLYTESLLPLIDSALAQLACPLSGEEKKSVLNYYRKITARQLIAQALKKRQFRRSLDLAKSTGLSMRDVINAFLFINKKPKES
jgi:hypothetical protein